MHLAGKGGQNMAEPVARLVAVRNDVLRCRAAASVVAARVILQRLIRGVGVNRGHAAALDDEGFTEDMQQQAQGSGGRRSGRDHPVPRVDGVAVDTGNNNTVDDVAGQAADHDARRTTGEVGAHEYLLAIDARRVDNEVDLEDVPRHLVRGIDGHDPAALRRRKQEVAFEPEVLGAGRLRLQQVMQNLRASDIGDGYDLDIVGQTGEVE